MSKISNFLSFLEDSFSIIDFQSQTKTVTKVINVGSFKQIVYHFGRHIGAIILGEQAVTTSNVGSNQTLSQPTLPTT